MLGHVRARRSEPAYSTPKLASRDSWASVLAFLQALCSLVDMIHNYYNFQGCGGAGVAAVAPE